MSSKTNTKHRWLILTLTTSIRSKSMKPWCRVRWTDKCRLVSLSSRCSTSLPRWLSTRRAVSKLRPVSAKTSNSSRTARTCPLLPKIHFTSKIRIRWPDSQSQQTVRTLGRISVLHPSRTRVTWATWWLKWIKVSQATLNTCSALTPTDWWCHKSQCSNSSQADLKDLVIWVGRFHPTLLGSLTTTSQEASTQELAKS